MRIEIKTKDIKKYANSLSYNMDMILTMEECSELIKACSKIIRNDNSNEKLLNDLIEEMADVYICLELIKYLFEISDNRFSEIIDMKMQRNLERI